MVFPKYVKRSTLYIDVFLIILYAPSLIADTFCGKPPEVKNGEALVEAFNTDFPVGTNIGYSCHVGFILNTIGNSYAVCVSDNGTAFWQPAVISCEPVCNHLPTLNNGKLKLEGRSPPFMLGDSIDYTCNSGYIADQMNKKITCTLQENVANWTEFDNSCKRKY
ncbi:sushi domain-containing protein [Trichonephila clavata]|uniref:Sushi domain-containing protein n=1 Tax=Trichonephila clavata TaxID=2740835 RepID=A0A8X6LDP6_TRICU|nr:sushi domain-containing protein [Trichonephila clavata]